MQFSCHFAVCSFIAVMQVAGATSAQTVQVPSLSGFGDNNNAFPFSKFGDPSRYQQIYASSEFSHGGVIDQIVFPHDDQIQLANPPGNIDLQVAFAYAATTVATASPVFAENIGDEFTVVLDGVVMGSSDKLILDVANLFNYDPTRGDLLVQILRRNSDHDAVFDASTHRQQSVTTRIWAFGIESQSGDVGLGIEANAPYGLVTQFSFVPEPSLAMQLGAILLVIVPLRRGRHG
jgi:hypothetical protein